MPPPAMTKRGEEGGREERGGREGGEGVCRADSERPSCLFSLPRGGGDRDYEISLPQGKLTIIRGLEREAWSMRRHGRAVVSSDIIGKNYIRLNSITSRHVGKEISRNTNMAIKRYINFRSKVGIYRIQFY